MIFGIKNCLEQFRKILSLFSSAKIQLPNLPVPTLLCPIDLFRSGPDLDFFSRPVPKMITFLDRPNIVLQLLLHKNIEFLHVSSKIVFTHVDDE